jgi:putative FmdB family regulatory protein
MPLYEYRCPNGHDFEKFYRSIGTASSEATCPVCGAFGARVMSAAGLVFKGSGFYITDYGKDGKKAEREAATAGKKKADSAATAAAASAAATAAKTAEAASSESAASSGESSAAAKSKDNTPPAASQPASTPAPAAPAATNKTSE